MSRRGWLAGLAAAVGFGLAVPVGALARDVTLDTAGGLTYVADQTPAVGSPGASPTVFARCPAETELVGGGVALDYGGTGAHLHGIYPTTTEGSEGSYALTFWNNSGAARVGTATVACARGAKTAYRGETGQLFSAPDVLSLTATCGNGEHVGGGGVFINVPAEEGVISSSYPVDAGDGDPAPDDGWRVKVRSRAGVGGSVTAYAICTDKPGVAYREKAVDLAVIDNNQPFVRCGDGQHAISAGVKITGPANEAILNRLETYDGGDGDVAPDDGGWAHVANTLEPRRAKVFALCKR